MATQRKVEVFSAGCPTCQEVVAMVQRLACPSCDISILDMHDLEVVKRAKALGVQSVPAVAINGQLAGCCANRGVDGVSEALISRTLRQLDVAAALGEGKKLYYANKEVYRLLRYDVKDKEGAGEQNQTVWLIDWQNMDANDFAIAEEVSIKGENKKRPDIVLYVNGIALGIVELKRSSTSEALPQTDET